VGKSDPGQVVKLADTRGRQPSILTLSHGASKFIPSTSLILKRMSQNKKTAPKRRTTPGRVAAIQAAQIQAVKAAKAAKARQTAKPAGTRSVAKATKKSAPKSSAVGRFLASSLAGLIPGGGALSGIVGEAGGWLGDKIGTALGLGEYDVAHIKQNSIINEGQTPPYMHDRNDLSVI